jgi:dUTP pyrophosphatase
MIEVKFKKLHQDAKMPLYAKEGDSGADVYSAEAIVDLGPGETRLVSTGIAIELPEGYDVQCRSRSGLAAKGICVLNSPGTIDNGYRGEIKVILHNTSRDKTFQVAKGDRIAQLVLSPVYKANFVEVEQLSDSCRGAGGFGSTGR